MSAFQSKRQGVLLFHGLGGTPAELRFAVNQLERAGYEVSCPLLVGMAAGTDLDNRLNRRDWIKFARQAYDELAERCCEVHVVGFSVGSLLALEIALQEPATLGRLVLLSPTFKADGWAIPTKYRLFSLVTMRWCARLFRINKQAPFGIKDDRIRRFVVDALRSGQAADISDDDILSINGVKVLQFNRLARYIRRRLGKISRPLFIVHSREDDQSSLDNTCTIQRRVRGPVELLIINNSYHVITLDSQRHLVVERVLNYLGDAGDIVPMADPIEDYERERAGISALRVSKGVATNYRGIA